MNGRKTGLLHGIAALAAAWLVALPLAADAAPPYDAELIFTPTARYPSSHASTIIELANRDLLCAWYAGQQEAARDVAVWYSRKAPGSSVWTRPAVLADDPQRPEGNPVLFEDPNGRLWLFYVTMYDEGTEEWDTCKVKCKWSDDKGQTWSPTLILRDELGWMTRNKPIVLDGGDWLLPIYDERVWTSSVMISTDHGRTWSDSRDIVAPGEPGNIQPTLAQLSDGSILALMRRGKPPERIWQARSHDRGRTWDTPTPTELPNPNAATDMVRLSNGHLVLAFNNVTDNRNVLTLAVSVDDGRTWAHKRDLENEPYGEFSYPAIIQARDGTIHVTYTYNRRNIKHVALNEEWIPAGE
ncbi:MAG: exo-alpha-sialidase [Armatimonadota bacterium]|nr:MAG: exo-alpha-sialidase [Armatimonadota bacterium]